MLKSLKGLNYVTALVVLTAIIISGLIFGKFEQKTSAEILPFDQMTKEKAVENLGNQAVYFEENKGQFNSKVRYFARGTNGYSLFLTGTDAVYVLSSPKSEVQSPKSKNEEMTLDAGLGTRDSTATAVYMTLAGANENAVSTGSEMLEHRTNYFKGEETNWRTDIPNFQTVRMSGVYEGIDTVWYGKQSGGVQYDFVVQPNANANQIEWEIKGANDVELTNDGDLIIKTVDGEIRQNKPFTYQETDGLRAEVTSGFVLSETSASSNSSKTFKVKFNVGNYDRSKSLTIDPSVNLSNLAFSTFLGGENFDSGRSIAVDSSGNLIISGNTFSTSFPTTPGTFDPTSNGNYDILVSKLNSTVSGLIYSTYIGGNLDDQPQDMKVDVFGNAYLTGFTLSSNFPTTAGVLDNTLGGTRDGFILKLNSTGSSLIYSTFIGGTDLETGYGIDVDLSGNAYVTGETFSFNFPVTPGAFGTTYNEVGDAFVSKINPTGSAIIYATFFGEAAYDSGRGIAIDSAGNAFVTGRTESSAIDVTPGAFDTTYNGLADAFVTKFNATGSALIYSSYLGGSDFDYGQAIKLNSNGEAYVGGITQSTGFPTTPGAFVDSQLARGFVTKINSSGSSLIYSSTHGGFVNDIAICSNGSVALVGSTSGSMQITANAYDTTFNGPGMGSDAFVSVLSPDGRNLIYATFFGGSSSDIAYATAVDAFGNIFITGTAFYSGGNFPITNEVLQPNNNGLSDAFVAKFGDFSISGRTVDTSGNPLPNTAIGLSGDNDGFMLSDAFGNFGFSDTDVGGSYLVSATQLLYNFNPSNYTISNLERNKKITFVGRPTTSGPTAAFADLGGDVTSTAGNLGLPNTNLTLIDTYGNVRTAVTDAQGNYEFQEVRTGGFYIVFAQREGYNFDPGNAAVTFLDENLDLDFTASPTSPRPVQDFDGDGKTDLAVFRPNEGNWYILQSQNNALKVVHFGLNGDIPLAEDYDGDERADIAVYRPSEGNWYRLNSSNGAFSAIHFGATDDKPIPADFDGDGKTDIAVYRPSSGVWHRLNSTDGSYHVNQFGISEDKPVPADFDSDGKADMVVYRPSNGVWHRLNSSDGNYTAFQFGLPEDKPMAADFDGDGTPDTAVYRPSNGVWYSLDSADGEFHAVQFGISTDTPIPADYNGDGRIEQAVYRGGTWYQLFSNGNSAVSQFGLSNDLPVAGIR